MTATAEAAPTDAIAAQVADPTPAPVPATIDQAGAVMASLPGVLGRDEFLSLAMQARILCMSGAAPEAVRNNPHVAFHVAMVGRDLGISASAALELVDIIKSNGQYRLSLSPQLLNGQIRRLGLGSIIPLVQQVDRCVAVALAPGGHADVRCGATWPEHHADCRCQGILGSTEFTWEEARMAGLVAQGCEPGAHTVKCMNRQTHAAERCNQGYVTYPKRMMWWRAGGYCADDWFPEAGLGLYSPEELGAVVDVEGRPIDPATVALPDGYAPKEPEPEQMADEQAVAELRHLIKHLPDDARAALGAKWREGMAEGNPYLQPLGKEGEPTKLPARQANKAKAVVQSFVARAAGGEWGDWEPPTPMAAASEPETPEGPQGATTPNTAQEPPDAASDDDTGAEAFKDDLEQQLADKPPAPPVNDVDGELEAIAVAYEALTPNQVAWMVAAVAKEGLKQDELERNADTRAKFRQLIAGAALQPAEASLVDRVAEIAAKATGHEPGTLL
jgi:hypothetical protein